VGIKDVRYEWRFVKDFTATTSLLQPKQLDKKQLLSLVVQWPKAMSITNFDKFNKNALKIAKKRDILLRETPFVTIP
jgi:hypothetical protein